VIDQVLAGSYTAQDLKDFSMYAKGGASLAPLNDGIAGGLPAEVRSLVEEKEQAIKDGLFRVDISERQPPGSVVAES
jgi:hypothetical protein